MASLFSSIYNRITGKPNISSKNLTESRIFAAETNKVKEIGLKSLNVSEQEKSKEKKDDNKILKANGKIIGVKHPFDYELLEGAYLSTPIIQGAVDKHVDSVLDVEFKFIIKKKKILKKYENFQKDTDFEARSRPMVRNMLLYGSSFSEIVWKGGNIKKVKLLDSKTMYIRRDERGNVKGYTQYFKNDNGNNAKPIFFKPEEILHLSFNSIGGSPYGTSIIRSLFGDGGTSVFKQYWFLQKSMAELLKRQIDAKLHVKVGDATHNPTQEVINKIASDIETSSNKSEWVTSYLVDMKIMGYNGKVLDLNTFLKYYNNQIVFGTEVPEVLLGTGNINEGLANVQNESFEKRIKSIKLNIKKELENLLFDRLLGKDNYRFIWHKHGKKDLEELNILIRFLAEKFVLTPSARNIIENRIRDLLGNEELDLSAYQKELDDVVEKKLELAKQESLLNKPEDEDMSDDKDKPDNKDVAKNKDKKNDGEKTNDNK